MEFFGEKMKAWAEKQDWDKLGKEIGEKFGP